MDSDQTLQLDIVYLLIISNILVATAFLLFALDVKNVKIPNTILFSIVTFLLLIISINYIDNIRKLIEYKYQFENLLDSYQYTEIIAILNNALAGFVIALTSLLVEMTYFILLTVKMFKTSKKGINISLLILFGFGILLMLMNLILSNDIRFENILQALIKFSTYVFLILFVIQDMSHSVNKSNQILQSDSEIENKLNTLMKLFEQGMITEEEYKSKRIDFLEKM